VDKQCCCCGGTGHDSKDCKMGKAMDFILLNKMIDEFYSDLKEQKNATQADILDDERIQYAIEQNETAASEAMYRKAGLRV